MRNVVEAMLGHVMLADDVRSALHASNLNGHGTVFVTRDGDVVSPGTHDQRRQRDSRPKSRSKLPPIRPIEEIESELMHAEYRARDAEERLAQRTGARVEVAASLAVTRGRAQRPSARAIAARGEAASAEQKVRMAHARMRRCAPALEEIREASVSARTRGSEELALDEQHRARNLPQCAMTSRRERAALEQLGAVMMEAASRVEARTLEPESAGAGVAPR